MAPAEMGLASVMELARMAMVAMVLAIALALAVEMAQMAPEEVTGLAPVQELVMELGRMVPAEIMEAAMAMVVETKIKYCSDTP